MAELHPNIKLTYETRMWLKAVVGRIKRERYWREKRMNFDGEKRPYDKKATKLKELNDSN